MPAWSEAPVIDDPNFILTEGGWKSPEDELQATIEAFAEDRSILMDGEMQPARCIFAARYAYLDEQLGLQQEGIPKPTCQKLQEFLSYSQYRGASLVFSNYYLNNPSSMFGHTFLRLVRSHDSRYGNVPLLDDAVNYAAQVADPHDPLYPVKGLTGLYPGRWAMLPYYSKVQEYSNFESRDLYEYDLQLSPADMSKLSLVLWEQGAFYSNYYFLSENCSYQILLLLEAVKPELELTKHLGISVIPIDTLHVLADAGILDQLHVRPSLLTRLEERYSQLNEHSRRYLAGLRKRPDPSAPQNSLDCDSHCRAEALDVLIEWQEYLDKNSGVTGAKELQDERRQLLMARADLRVPAAPLVINRSFAPPHEAHRTTTVGVLARQSTDGPGLLLRLRPALHDPISRVDGYGPGMGISFLDTYVQFDPEKKPEVTRLDILEITSLPQTDALWRPWAWYFHTGYSDRRNDEKVCEQLETCQAVDLGFALGPQLRVNSALSASALFGVKGLYDLEHETTLGRVQAMFALHYQQGPVAIQAQVQPEPSSTRTIKSHTNTAVSYQLNRRTEARLRSETIGEWNAVDVGLLFFF